MRQETGEPCVGALPPRLGRWDEEFVAAAARAEAVTAGLDDTAFNWRPGEGCWSIAECLGHLNLAGNGALRMLDRLIAEAPAAPVRRFRPRLMQRVFLWGVEPPYRRRFRSTERLLPPSHERLDSVLPEFLRVQQEIRRRVHAAAGRNLAASEVRHPLGIRLNLGEWLAFLAAHERRHLWKAERGRADARCPAR